MSGITEFYVSTEVLQDDTLILSNNYHAFHVAGDKGPKSQGPSSVIDQETEIAYFTQIQKNGIGCWDINVKLTPETFSKYILIVYIIIFIIICFGKESLCTRT